MLNTAWARIFVIVFIYFCLLGYLMFFSMYFFTNDSTSLVVY